MVSGQVYLFMIMVFPNGNGLFQQNNAPCCTAHIVQEQFEEHYEEFKVLPWMPRTCWNKKINKSDPRAALPLKLQELKDLLQTSWCHIPQGTFRGLVKSMPQWTGAVLAAHKGPTAY